MDPLQELDHQIEKSIRHLKQNFTSLQTGRAHPALLEEITIHVAAYGSNMELKSLANVSCPDNKTLRVEPWDKGTLKDVEKAIIEANLGLNPQNMGEYLLVPVPPLTEERRKQMVKLVHEESENARIAVRNARHAALKDIKQKKDDKDLSEDEAARIEKKIQDRVDTANESIDEIASHKEKEVLGK